VRLEALANLPLPLLHEADILHDDQCDGTRSDEARGRRGERQLLLDADQCQDLDSLTCEINKYTNEIKINRIPSYQVPFRPPIFHQPHAKLPVPGAISHLRLSKITNTMK
jgi:hypothetical protein